jgi:hypothetical protein
MRLAESPNSGGGFESRVGTKLAQLNLPRLTRTRLTNNLVRAIS